MPFEMVRNDIVKMYVDVIVNAANPSLLGGGGVDGAIHRAAGPGLLEECRQLQGCSVGEAKMTHGYNLPCQYVIHTVGPVWRDGHSGEEEMLSACYRNSLALAQSMHCQSIAFPLISAGAYGYPPEQAMRVAVDTIRRFLEHNDMMVYLVVYGKESLRLSSRFVADVKQYIDDHYVEEHFDAARERNRPACSEPVYADSGSWTAEDYEIATCPDEEMFSLDEALQQIDETFTQMVLRKIDEKGMTDPECYKRANLDRKLFSKIRSDHYYRPGKRTALALAIALELPLQETKEMLMKAGFALSHSSKFDIIVEYCILHGIYDIYEVNQLLFSYDQTPLGA